MTVNKIPLSQKDRKELAASVKKIIGQLNSILGLLEKDAITDQTFIQLLAVKGGASKLCKEMISKGLVPKIKTYSLKEIDNALSIIFKLD
jgi:DNA-binding FrmR family transcriptional regulator